MPGHVEWFGDRISARMREASRVAIDATMADTVTVASGFLPGSLGTEIIEHARHADGRMRGLWGSKSFLVWIYEVGSFRKPSGWDISVWTPGRRYRGTRTAKKVLANSEQMFGRRVHHPTIPARHALRKASDVVYPTLTLRIARAFVRGR